ncbi:MAG: Biotin carboxyl carrier protein of acetyl-CoA carboxylase [Alphaproteobacteria bacterium MarineAlpha5_Bin12]|nr:acetyl-CoA carboxylase biotin carboxyl carrier protein subunit [Pelagibacteraceae bacterium]PPR40677.1 MAG: Biotin carboxyl carrier protein of acetyl-CoA carboxylase [Alphaproteobacteria bacterium MarineAlpha5_Bin12]
MLNFTQIPFFILCLIVILLFIIIIILTNLIRKIDNLPNKSISQSTIKSNLPNKKSKEVINEDDYIISPMVGIIYLTPEPNKPQFVKEGEHIKQGDTVAIIEAMKTYSNVRASKSGIVKKIYINNGSPVEYGEKLFSIE